MKGLLKKEYHCYKIQNTLPVSHPHDFWAYLFLNISVWHVYGNMKPLNNVRGQGSKNIQYLRPFGKAHLCLLKYFCFWYIYRLLNFKKRKNAGEIFFKHPCDSSGTRTCLDVVLITWLLMKSSANPPPFYWQLPLPPFLQDNTEPHFLWLIKNYNSDYK